MDKMLEAALGYAKQGWPVFPVNPESDTGKKPYPNTNGVFDATTDPKKITRLWERHPGANIGCHVGAAHMMVLDLDPGSDIKEVKAKIPDLPDTHTKQKTPRGGVHLFYALGEDEVVAPSASKVAPYVDVRSHGSYVCLAPSVTPHGEYEWINGVDFKPAFRSDILLKEASAAREKSKDRDTWIIEPDLEENIARATAWLRREAQIAVEGQGGDHIAYSTAAYCKSLGISQDLALSLMWEHWNPRCNPPWSIEEHDHFEQKVINGYSYNTSPPGNMTDAYHKARRAELFKPVIKEVEVEPEEEGEEKESGFQVSAGRFRFVDRNAMDQISEPDWLIKDFLPHQGFGLMFGKRGTYKSFLAIDMALSIATGGTWPRPKNMLWPVIPRRGRILYVAGEGRSSLRRRIQAWEQAYNGGHRVDADRFVLADPVPNAGSIEEVEGFIDGAMQLADGFDLVVIDTISRAMQGLNENAQQDASYFTRLTEYFRTELGAATLAITHEGYASDTRARGSSVFEADADTVVHVKREPKQEIVALEMTKQKDAPEWELPRYASLHALDPRDKMGSLIPRRLEKEREEEIRAAAPAREKEEKTAVEAKKRSQMLIKLDKVVMEILATNRLKAYTQTHLADIIATRQDVEISSARVRRELLTELRETNGTESAKCFDANQRRWKYRMPEKQES